MPEARIRILIPGGEGRAEIEIDRSRFIAQAGPVMSVEAAREFIQLRKSEHPGANHHVPAFLIGHGNGVIAHCSDDGEPAGTAGKPALVVLQGSGLGDVVVVVTRYFGGIKLGTGGLVKAYTQSVQEVLQLLPRAEKVATCTVMLAFAYTYLERIRQFAAACGGVIIEEEFGADISMMVRFREENLAEFQEAVKNLTRGSVQAIIIEQDPQTIMPLK